MPQRRARRRSYLFEFASKCRRESSIPRRLSVLLCACRRRLFGQVSPAGDGGRDAFGDRTLAMLAEVLAGSELGKRYRRMEFDGDGDAAESGHMPEMIEQFHVAIPRQKGPQRPADRSEERRVG